MSMLKYSAKYFNKTAKIVANELPNSIVVIQFFQRKDDVLLAGINEILQMLKKETDTSKYIIRAEQEGAIINNGDIVLELEGHYPLFGEYEGIIDGILSRASSLATNARKIKIAAGNKPVIYMGDRADHYINQERDGYAIALGGLKVQVTDAHIALHDGSAVGTMPHALIQMFEGNLNAALTAYKKTFPNEKISALVDFNNDVISESLKALAQFGKNLGAVRVDTSPKVSDAMFLNDEEYGVTPTQIKSLRNALDRKDGKHVQIIVSSGFDENKIKEFEESNTPVDIYGVGGALLKINIGFTGDAVRINGKDIAKIGRGYKEHNLKEVA